LARMRGHDRLLTLDERTPGVRGCLDKTFGLPRADFGGLFLGFWVVGGGVMV